MNCRYVGGDNDCIIYLNCYSYLRGNVIKALYLNNKNCGNHEESHSYLDKLEAIKIRFG